MPDRLSNSAKRKRRKGEKTDVSKRPIFLLVCFIVVFAAWILRVGWIQIVRGDDLSRQALDQQTSDDAVSAKRGNIYDRNYKVLATNATVETISITPETVRKSIENNNLTVDSVAGEIAGILELDKDLVKDKIAKKIQSEPLKKKVEKSVADKLREYVNSVKLSGVAFTEDVKRYYPYNNFAAQVIGFCGTDNQGLEGIESVYDDELSGIPGRVVSAQKSTGIEDNNSYENYIAAQDGNSVVLTIDETIQSYVQKNLEAAAADNKVAEGAAAIVIDVNTCEILAMCTEPDYDLNAPFEITDAIEQKYPGIREELDSLEKEAYNERLGEVMQSVRRNKAVVDSYEPGSTFKSVTASVALDTGSCKLEDTFNCGGSYVVADRSIRCANTNGHGLQDFTHAVQNSCNPAFIQIGQKTGKDKFIDGVNAFGFFKKTGIELPGEAIGAGFTKDNMTEVDLATSSFGQSITVTPLQMVAAVSAVANGGTLMKPHLVKQIVNSDMGIVEDIKPQAVRQVISRETSEEMCKILESVVSEGGGKNAYLAGYRIAGKTGTSEKQPRGQSKYIASFVGFAPADDPQVLCLVLLDEPNGDSYYGGTIAAPVVRDILGETLQYLGIEAKYTEGEEEFADVEVPDVSGMSKADAGIALDEYGFNVKISGSADMIVDQIPKAHTKVMQGSTIVLYTAGERATRTVTVPSVVGQTPAEANAALVNDGLNAKIKGVSKSGRNATCIGQSPVEGTVVEPGTIITLNFRYDESETTND